MVRKICLDSDVLIELLSNNQETKDFLESLDADFYTTSINAFELWYGRKRSETVFELLSWLHMLDFNEKSAKLAGDMLRELKENGAMLDMRDLFIAVICMQNDIELLSYNQKHFFRLKEKGLMLVEK